ncbi:hypothetical protein M758_UG075300 [Ceratodon purpureus]|nr:hypothetical protein M758_UG075300 [Ceratodon purpureus]
MLHICTLPSFHRYQPRSNTSPSTLDSKFPATSLSTHRKFPPRNAVLLLTTPATFEPLSSPSRSSLQSLHQQVTALYCSKNHQQRCMYRHLGPNPHFTEHHSPASRHQPHSTSLTTNPHSRLPLKPTSFLSPRKPLPQQPLHRTASRCLSTASSAATASSFRKNWSFASQSSSGFSRESPPSQPTSTLHLQPQPPAPTNF